MLTDAGPLAAIVDGRDSYHDSCVAELRRLAPPMVTLLPAFTEAMYLAGRRAGWAAQDRLWVMVERGVLLVQQLESADLDRARELMRHYRDLPMDFADATLVAYAERENLHEVFTVNRRDFSTYRLRGRTAFTIYP